MAYVASSRKESLTIFARLGEMVAAFRETLEAHRVFRQTFNELNALSDRELADLGIARSMISRIAYDAAYGEEINATR
ncbi:DUF1127 domain-containing protein [Rhodobacterales bacterium HKCCE2091]|nr:DUF1127 domain-containing protein [Rhodobacterales bacterium HKCCE2091]